MAGPFGGDCLWDLRGLEGLSQMIVSEMRTPFETARLRQISSSRSLVFADSTHIFTNYCSIRYMRNRNLIYSKAN
ncbi:hypothetical protein CDAR_308101 [Caerostris darwini]|uniref:Uncharacterized protein n=1 Tax=Caerostris darwini TaxID=1538125 RepID=A0AAV4USD2_9ARAC|nr:hypothetical protein CDAR_308101 [Caerostris darwini]